jgi:hypothetical protein
MDTVNHLRDTIERILIDHAGQATSDEDVEYQTIFDRTHDHYLLVQVGWGDRRRLYGTLAHVDIKNGKAWVQHDYTEEGIATQLSNAGIPTSQIVLGYRIPEVRAHTGYAVV